MNTHQRYIQSLTFGNPDKVFFFPGIPRRPTIKYWRETGMPDIPAGSTYLDVLAEATRIDRYAYTSYTDPGVDTRMIPQFEEKVLEHKDGHYVVQDWKGNICEISDEFDVTTLRDAVDFVTRRWIKLPVESRADWEDMKKRYNPDDPARYPVDFEKRCQKLWEQDSIVRLCIRGPFDQLREWCGFEGICMLMIDDPEFVHEMVSFWKDFMLRAMKRLLDAKVLDVVYVNEDIAYKEKPMISPEMNREFIMPTYLAWNKAFKAAGVPVINLDSDGRVDVLMDQWIEAGFNVTYPLEVAAGCDIVAYRKKYQKKIGFFGGIDKRCIAAGGSSIVQELKRIEPVLLSGGYIPGCDHGVPHDISWPNFVNYNILLAKMTGWL